MDEEFFDISPWGNNDDEEEEILNLKKEKFLLSPKMQNYKSSRKNLQEFLQKNQKEKTEKPHILLVKKNINNSLKNKIDSQKSILNTEHTQIKFSSLSNQFKKYDKDKLPLISYEQTPEKKEISKNQNINFNRIKYFNSKQELKNQRTELSASKINFSHDISVPLVISYPQPQLQNYKLIRGVKRKKTLENIETNSELNQIPRYKLLSAKFEKMNASPNFNYSLKQQITKNERLLHLCRISSLNWSNQHKTYNISNHLKSLKNEKYFFNS